jgi:hypothetical protein
MKKLLFFILLFSNATKICAQSENKDVTITTSGSGLTKEEAQQSALRSAIEQSYGTFISSKTEIFNDKIVADQMSSVSSGNIKSFEILNQDQLPNGSWGVTLKAIVSVDKLTSFVEAKGIAIEIKGGMFALNIKQQLLNEQGEIKAVSEMVGLLHEALQISFDYIIKSGEPKSLDNESKNWDIPLIVKATCNKNIDFCASYFKNTLAALSLSPSEVETYNSLNKLVFPINVTYQNQSLKYYLRKKSSLSAIQSLMSNWEAYNRLFAVNSGLDESYGQGNVELFQFSGSKRGSFSYNTTATEINFPSIGQQTATFTWNDKRTLAQIEQIEGYSVKPRGVISHFKNGGYVVKDGYGLVLSLYDVGNYNWENAKPACEELYLNGYSDWRLPSKEEKEFIYNNLCKTNFFRCGLTEANYWSITEGNNYGRTFAWYFFFGNTYGQADNYVSKDAILQVRAVRSFK